MSDLETKPRVLDDSEISKVTLEILALFRNVRMDQVFGILTNIFYHLFGCFARVEDINAYCQGIFTTISEVTRRRISEIESSLKSKIS